MALDINKYQHGYRHKLYSESVALYGDMKIHIDGEYPKKLIEERRPHEPLHIKAYRQLIFQHISAPIINKPLESIGRVRKSSDYDIKFKEGSQPPRIRPGETLQDYFTTGFPFWTSATNWAFSVLLRQLAMDANAMVVMMPSEKKWEFQKDQYIKFYPFIFNSDQVLDYVAGEFIVVKSTDTSSFTIGSNQFHNGDVYYYADTQVMERWQQGEGGKMVKVGEYLHGTGQLHAWKIGQKVKRAKDGDFLMESRLSPMLPHLNEAVREYSDLQAGVVQHLFLERWELAGQQCPACKGIGRENVDGEWIKCRNQSCDQGLLMSSPYKTKLIGKDKAGNYPSPPFAGYVEKDPKIIEIQDTRIDRHGYKALAAINMEFLADTQLNQSGLAKEVDKDETNNFVYNWGEDIVRNLDLLAKSESELRYWLVVPSKEERLKMLPAIPVPEKFNVLTSNVLMEGIGKMRTSKINPLLILEAEKAFAGKEFNADPQVRAKLDLILSLDPLAGHSEEDKMMMLNSRGITHLDYITSCNIIAFVEKAMEENKAFEAMPRAKQREVIAAYALEVEKALAPSTQVLPGQEEEEEEEQDPEVTKE